MGREIAVAHREVGDAAEIDVFPERLVRQRMEQVKERAEEQDVERHDERETPRLLAIAPEPVLGGRAEPASPLAVAEMAEALIRFFQVGELSRIGEIAHRHRIELESAAHAHHGARRGVAAELDRLQADLAVPEAGEVHPALRDHRLREIAGLEARIDEVALLELRAAQIAVREMNLTQIAADEARVLEADVAEYRPAQV